MAKHVFNFEESVEIIEVNGEEFKLNLADSSLRDMVKKFRAFEIEYREQAAKFGAMDPSTVTEEQEQEIWETSEALIRKTIESTLGEGEFDRAYKLSGQSLEGMGNFVAFISEIVEARFKKAKAEKAEEYTGNRAQRRAAARAEETLPESEA